MGVADGLDDDASEQRDIAPFQEVAAVLGVCTVAVLQSLAQVRAHGKAMRDAPVSWSEFWKAEIRDDMGVFDPHIGALAGPSCPSLGLFEPERGTRHDPSATAAGSLT
jgi:hypothetical protein